LASSTSKKVQIWRFDRELLSGFVNPPTYLLKGGVELLNLAGMVSVVPYGEIKRVHFVKDFTSTGKPLERTTFLARPKLNGLWLRMVFKDAEVLEGVLPNNLLQLEPEGFTIIPPDYSYNNQKLFVPRSALSEVQVLGIVGSPLGKIRAKAKQVKNQISLFD